MNIVFCESSNVIPILGCIIPYPIFTAPSLITGLFNMCDIAPIIFCADSKTKFVSESNVIMYFIFSLKSSNVLVIKSVLSFFSISSLN